MRTEDKVMNNGKLQAKKEKLKSLHCPSPQSSLFNFGGSSLNAQLPFLVSKPPAQNTDQNPDYASISSKHNSRCSTPSPHNIQGSATSCLKHNDESGVLCPQRLFIDLSAGLLHQGQSVRFCASGQSMHPTIKEGEIITVVPVAVCDIRRGDILFYKLGKKVVAHRLISIKEEKSNSTSHSSANSLNHSPTQSMTHASTLNSMRLFILRGDASLTCDEPVGTHQILGKVVSVEKRSRSLNLYSRKARIFRFAYAWASRLKRLMLQVLTVDQEVGLASGGFR
jgi:hypothetical protein